MAAEFSSVFLDFSHLNAASAFKELEMGRKVSLVTHIIVNLCLYPRSTFHYFEQGF